jgi:outer membrane receptor protein involved in Fe transport
MTYINNTQVSYDGNYVRQKHTFRYGGSFNHPMTAGFQTATNWLTVNGTYNLGTLTNLEAQGVDVTDPLNYPLAGFSTGSPFGFFWLMGCHHLDHGCRKNNRTAFYGGDIIKLTRRLTVNLGLRVQLTR